MVVVVGRLLVDDAGRERYSGAAGILLTLG